LTAHDNKNNVKERISIFIKKKRRLKIINKNPKRKIKANSFKRLHIKNIHGLN